MARPGLKLAAGAVLAVVAIACGVHVYQLNDRSVVDKLVCIEHDPQPLAWACDRLLSQHRFTPAEVAELNDMGGATFPLSLTDKRKAETYLAMFIAHGVDVNAPTKPSGLTPLHMVIAEPDNVRLLLKHGAQPGTRDAAGETPLELARRAAAQGRPGAQETLRLLAEQHR